MLKSEAFTPEAIISYQADVPEEKQLENKKIVTKVVKKPSAPSSTAVPVITAKAFSDISLPSPEVEVDTLNVDFGEAEDFGEGWLNSNGAGLGRGSQSFSFFGKSGSEGMPGRFYDLKQTYKEKTSDLGRDFKRFPTPGIERIKAYQRVFKKIARQRFSKKALGNYLKAETELSFTNLIIPRMSANEAVKIFNVEGKVKPAGWMIVYEAKINPSKEGYYRFVGRFDDVIAVYINNLSFV